MSSLSLLWGAIFAVLILISAIIGALIAVKRGLSLAISRLGFIVCCFVFALPITTAIAGTLPNLTTPILQDLLGEYLSEIATHSPTTMEILLRLPLFVVSPALFIIVFYLLKWITLIPHKALKKQFPPDSADSSRFLSGILGALTSFICTIAILLPLWGSVGVAHRAIQTISQVDTSFNKDLHEAVEMASDIDNAYLEPLVSNITAEIFTDQGDSPIFRSLTKVKLTFAATETSEEYKARPPIGQEIDLLAETAADAISFVSTIPNNFKLSDLNRTHVDDLHNLVNDINQSELLKNICSEWVASTTSAWKDGHKVMGVSDPFANDPLKPVAHAVYGFLSTTSGNQLMSDAHTAINVLGVLVDHQILSHLDKASLFNQLGNSSFGNDLAAQIGEHTRLLATIANLVGPATQAWSDGNPYMGIAEPPLKAEIIPMAHMLYGYLATTRANILIDDFNAATGLMALVNKHPADQNILFIGTFYSDLNQFNQKHSRFNDYFANWLAELTSAWIKGNSYKNFAAPKTNAVVTPVVNSIFRVLSTTNGQLIHDDLAALADIIGVMNKYDVFNSEKSSTQLAKLFRQTTFVDELNAAISNHERFAPVLDAVASVGLSAISGQLKTSLPSSPMMTDLSGKISTSFNGNRTQSEDARTDAISREVQAVIAENKVDVPDGVSDLIADIVINKFGSQQSVTEKEVTDYLVGLYESAGDLDGFFR